MNNLKPCRNFAVASRLVMFAPSRLVMATTQALAYNPIRRYIDSALSKISKLVLADYNFSIGVHSPHRAFFVRNISMHSHVMAKLERDIFICAGNLLSLSANPFQLCHLNYLAVIGKALSQSIGAHTHA